MKTISLTLVSIICSVYGFSQIGIGTTIPNESAILDVESIDKGLLIPRVDLDDVSTAAPINTPATGLLVYNQGGDETDGFYYWNGTSWIPFTTGQSTALFSAENGLAQVGTKVELGGALTKNTTITNNGNHLDVSGDGELQISDAENPTLRIHSSANETNKGGRIEFNENDSRYGYSLRHQTSGGQVNSTQREDGLWFEMKKNDVYTPAFGFGDNGGTQPRIGVLTTSPQTDFHTAGTGLFQSGSSSSSIGGTTYLAENNQLALENSNNGSVVQYFNSTGADPKSVKLGLNPTYDGQGVFSIQTAANGSTFADRINIKMDGNVGISNSNPQYKLDVSGSSKVSGNLALGTEPTTYKLDVQGTTMSNSYRIDNISSTPNGEQSRNLVYNPSTKLVEVEPNNSGAYTFSGLADGSTFSANTGNSNAIFKLFIQTGNGCGHTVINEYQVAGSNLNGVNWEIKSIQGISTSGSSTLNQVNRTTVDATNTRPNCADGSAQTSFNYRIQISGQGVLTISNTTGTFRSKMVRLF